MKARVGWLSYLFLILVGLFLVFCGEDSGIDKRPPEFGTVRDIPAGDSSFGTTSKMLLESSPSWTNERDQTGAYYGYSVANAGDVNGDGYTDVLVGAPYFDNGQTNEGRAFLFLGGPTGPSATPSWTTESDQAEAQFGYSVASAGDVNGDGYADVLVGAPFYDNGETDEGRVYLFLGSASGLATTPAWTAEGNQAGARFGTSIASAGDVDGDGDSDVIIGAPYFDNGQADEGMAFVYQGTPGGLSALPAWSAESNQAGAQFGYSVASAGDVQRDGYADIVVGAPYYTNGESFEGWVGVFHGSASGPSPTPNWTTESNQANALYGNSVASAGDVQGDGYSDLIVGAYLFDNGETDEGRAFLYVGSAAGLAAAPAWTAESNQAGAQFGWAVAGAGDVNGDGFADVVIGANLYDNGQTDEGRAYLYRGGSSGLATTAGWTAESNQAGAYFGHAVAGVGDANGDGFGDVLFGTYLYDGGQTDEGRTYLYRGLATGLSGSDWNTWGEASYDEFGYSIAGAGDVNGDGYGDVIVGAPYGGTSDEGRAYVYLGGTSGLNSTPIWTAESDQSSAYFGLSVAGAGDVNGDGYADVVVGAPNFNNGETDEGRAYLYLGSATGPSSTPAWTAESNQAYAEFGYSVAGAGDVNGDGYADVVVGARYYDNGQSSEGKAFLYLGSAAGLASTPTWTAESNQDTAYFGYSVAGAGDVNGDGYADVIIGARLYDNGQTDEGRAYVYLGGASGLSTTPAWTAESNQSSADFGFSVAGAGDVNGDGYADVIVGARYFNNGETDEGRAYLYLGSASGLSTTPDWTAEADKSYSNFGASVAGAGDVNGDGYGDVLVGAPNYDGSFTNEGMAYLFLGSATGLSSTASWTNGGWESNQYFGYPVASLGDANGDGFGDVAVAAPWENYPSTDAGNAYAFFGGDLGYTGKALGLKQFKADGATRIAVGGTSGGSTVILKGRAFNPSSLGGKVRLEVEVAPIGQPFAGAGLVRSTAVLPGDEAIVTVPGLTGGPQRWRARTVFPGAQGYGRWSSFGGNTEAEADFVVPLPLGAICPNGSICASGFCVDGVCCDGACSALCMACTAGKKGSGTDGTCGFIASGADPDDDCANDGASSCQKDGTCDGSGACRLYAGGTVCRAAAGPCDAVENCPGGGAPCPPDALEPNTTVCRAAAGGCDALEYCTGISINCPSDAYQPSTVECRPSAGFCDVAEFCPGSSVNCPADAFQPSSVECRASAGVCDVAENCTGWSAVCPLDTYQPNTVTCRSATGLCDVAENCPGTSADCPADALRPNTFECRASAGVCDLAENCTGSSVDCPGDAFKPNTTECRVAAGFCDLAENCTGSAATCPTDSFKPNTVECRASADVCDLAENCTGGSANCPADSFKPNTVECRASAGVCDVAENCTGSSASCPSEFFKPNTVECRAAAGTCDAAENCTGTSADCPTDSLMPNTLECRSAAGVCDLGENCTGSSADCPADIFKSNTTECRATAGPCDVAENCTGSSAACPIDSFQPVTVECRASAGICDLAENCAGTLASCPADSFKPSTVECRTPVGLCDVAENCPGTSADCPADALRPNTFECRASAGVCDLAENCTGSSVDCPGDAFKPNTTECRVAAGFCDLAENCTGSAATCPTDSFKPNTVECRASAGLCDVGENCTGSSVNCPADAFKPNTAECRSSAGVCDLVENCTGSSATCPTDTFKTNTVECRASAGVCDLAENCTGSSVDCPADGKRTSTYVCRFSGGICDIIEYCDGVSDSCPNDGFMVQGAGCVDGNPCTKDDACDGNVNCVGTAYACPSPTECHTSIVCDGLGGCTVTNKAAGTACTADSNQCTDDVCNAGVCTHPNKQNTATCDDGNACTKHDKCNGSGGCVGTAYTCVPTDCHATSVCDGLDGCTVTNKAAGTACTADSNQCTDDVCNAGVCTHPNKQNTATCDDGNACTKDDKCNGSGACAGVTYMCPTPSQCQGSVTCDGAGGCTVVNKADTEPCSTGDPCSINDHCNGSGNCVSGGVNPACSDAGVPDAGVEDGGVEDTDGSDAGKPDAGVATDTGTDGGIVEDVGAEAGQLDAGQDAGGTDTGAADSGTPDTGTPDIGLTDTGTPDAGPGDAGIADAGGEDTGVKDGGAKDGGSKDVGALRDGGVATQDAAQEESGSAGGGCSCSTLGL